MKTKNLLILLMTSLVSITGCDAPGQDSESTSSGNRHQVDGHNFVPEVVIPTRKSSADFVVPEGGYNGGEVTVTFYHTMGDALQAELTNAIADFNEMYPNITVDAQQIGGYDEVRDQIKTELSAGVGPSMAYCYSDHVALYNKTKKVVKLQNLIKSDKTNFDGSSVGMTQDEVDDYYSSFWSEGYAFEDGSLYTMPFSKSTEVLYYNKTFFDEHNLKVPTHWFSLGSSDDSSLEYVCQKIKELDPNCTPLGYDSEANWFITMCQQLGSAYTSASGTDHFLFNNAVNRQFVSEFRNWYKSGWLTTQTIYKSYTSGLFTSETKDRCYMCIGSSAGASHQFPTTWTTPFEVGISSVPQDDPDEAFNLSQGPSVCIFNKGDEQEVMASWLLLKFLTTDTAFQGGFSMASGYIPVVNSTLENPTYKTYMNNASGTTSNGCKALSTKVALEQIDTYFTSPAFLGSSEARDQVGDLLVKVLTGEGYDDDASIETAFAEAVSTCIANSK